MAFLFREHHTILSSAEVIVSTRSSATRDDSAQKKEQISDPTIFVFKTDFVSCECHILKKDAQEKRQKVQIMMEKTKLKEKTNDARDFSSQDVHFDKSPKK